MRQGLHENFDKLLLLALVLVMLGSTHHLTHEPGEDPATLSWSRENTNLVLGALIGLITGDKLRSIRGAINVQTGDGGTMVSAAAQGDPPAASGSPAGVESQPHA